MGTAVCVGGQTDRIVGLRDSLKATATNYKIHVQNRKHISTNTLKMEAVHSYIMHRHNLVQSNLSAN